MSTLKFMNGHELSLTKPKFAIFAGLFMAVVIRFESDPLIDRAYVAFNFSLISL